MPPIEARTVPDWFSISAGDSSVLSFPPTVTVWEGVVGTKLGFDVQSVVLAPIYAM
jgi:hypothetical protein